MRSTASRPITVVGLAALLLLLLLGCSPDPSAAPSESSGSSGGSPGASQVLIWSDPDLAGALREVGAQYQRATGTVVTITPVPRADMLAQVRSLAPQGRGPDLLVADGTELGNLVADGLLAPVDISSRAAGFTRWSLDAFRLAGTSYGMPIMGDGLALLRNVKMSPKAPKSIEEMASTGQKLVASGKAVVPMALPIGSRGDARHWYPFYSAAGGYLYAQQSDGSFDPNDLGVGLAGSVLAGRLLAQMAKAGDFDASLDAKACAALFAAGRTPYLIGGMADAKKAADAGVTVSVTAVPGYDHSPEATPAGPVAYRGLAMSAFARDRAAATQFLVTGIANTAAMTLLLKGDPGLPAWSESLARAALNPIVSGFADAAEVSGPAPNVANVGTAWRELSRAQVAILGGASPKAAMGRARTRITSASVLD